MHLTTPLIAAACAAAILVGSATAGTSLRGTPISSGDAVRARIDDATDADTYVFDAVAGSTLQLSFTAARGGESTLDPRLVLVGADCGLVDSSSLERRRGRKLTWSKVVLPVTGRYALGVTGLAASAGDYSFSVRTRPPRRHRFADVPVAAGGVAQLTYAAPPGSTARVRVSASGGSFAVDTLACAGFIEGGDALTLRRGGTRAVGTLTHDEIVCDRALVVRAGDAPIMLRGAVTVTPQRTIRRSVELTRAEPQVFAIQPEAALPGARVAVVGSGFLTDGRLPTVLFGSLPGLDPVVLSDTLIDVTVPAGSGAALVTVYDADGLEGRAPRVFTYAGSTPDAGTGPTLTGLLGFWDFAGSAGPAVADFSGNGNSASIAGAAQLGGGGVQFDGVDDHVVYSASASGAPPAELASVTSGTITVRFRYHDIVNGETVAESLPLVYYGVDATDVAAGHLDSLAVYIGHLGIEDLTRRQVYFTVIRDEQVQLCFDSGDIWLEADRWYDYAVTIAPGGEHHAYLDGVEFDRDYNSGTSEASDAFFATVERARMFTTGYGLLGISRTFWRLNGAVAEVRVYDRALSASEIADLAGR